jgi:hypothetical protein
VRPCLKNNCKKEDKNISLAGHWWLMSVILPTWEAEIRRITFGGQLRYIVAELLC